MTGVTAPVHVAITSDEIASAIALCCSTAPELVSNGTLTCWWPIRLKIEAVCVQAGKPKQAIACCLSLGQPEGAREIAAAIGFDSVESQIETCRCSLSEHGYVMPT